MQVYLVMFMLLLKSSLLQFETAIYFHMISNKASKAMSLSDTVSHCHLCLWEWDCVFDILLLFQGDIFICVSHCPAINLLIFLSFKKSMYTGTQINEWIWINLHYGCFDIHICYMLLAKKKVKQNAIANNSLHSSVHHWTVNNISFIW